MLVAGVVRGGLSEARGYAAVTAFSIGAVAACLPTLAPIGIANEFLGRFYRLG